jgi:hypothetical protein
MYTLVKISEPLNYKTAYFYSLVDYAKIFVRKLRTLKKFFFYYYKILILFSPCINPVFVKLIPINAEV